MTQVNTSDDAVDMIARWHETEGHAWASDGADHELRDRHRATAALLRALLAERDEARRAETDTLAENDALRFDRNNFELMAAEAYSRGWRDGRDAGADMAEHSLLPPTAAAIRALEPPGQQT